MKRELGAEAIGTGLLFCTLIGSGIMAEKLAGGNVAVALLGVTIAVAGMLYVLITKLGPISGAHFNPAVTLVIYLRGGIAAPLALAYIPAQLVGGIIGVWAAHVMFELPVLQVSQHVRTGGGQWLGEFIATFGLVFTVLGTAKAAPHCVPNSVALYITAAIWFTSSTSFANPAITIARSLSDTFCGIAPADVPAFIAAQIVGALIAHWLGRWLFDAPEIA
jgi:glycerol uptake facilitator-like aquaporin